MLTREEEEDRALNISQLYFTATNNSRLNQLQPQYVFSWWQILTLGVVLPLPYIAINIGYAFFTSLNYQTRTDVAAAGLIFWVAGLLTVFWMYGVIKYCRERLSYIAVNARYVFWFTCLFVAPSILFLKYVIIGNPPPADAVYLSIAAVKYLIVSVLVSVITMMVFTSILERLKVDNGFRVGLVVVLTAMPYVVGFMTNSFINNI